MASRWTEFETGIGTVVKAYSPTETRTGLYQCLDGLLDRATINAYKRETTPGITTRKIGDLGEGKELFVGVFGYERRCRIGERLLTGERTVQPVVALVENNGIGKIVKPLPYAEDIVRLPVTLPARVIGCLADFNSKKVS